MDSKVSRGEVTIYTCEGLILTSVLRCKKRERSQVEIPDESQCYCHIRVYSFCSFFQLVLLLNARCGELEQVIKQQLKAADSCCREASVLRATVHVAFRLRLGVGVLLFCLCVLLQCE